jgi:hypothetical protein
MPTAERPRTGNRALDDLLAGRLPFAAALAGCPFMSAKDLEVRYVFREYRYYAPPCHYIKGADACPTSRFYRLLKEDWSWLESPSMASIH